MTDSPRIQLLPDRTSAEAHVLALFERAYTETMTATAPISGAQHTPHAFLIQGHDDAFIVLDDIREKTTSLRLAAMLAKSCELFTFGPASDAPFYVYQTDDNEPVSLERLVLDVDDIDAMLEHSTFVDNSGDGMRHGSTAEAAAVLRRLVDDIAAYRVTSPDDHQVYVTNDTASTHALIQGFEDDGMTASAEKLLGQRHGRIDWVRIPNETLAEVARLENRGDRP